MWKIHPAIGVSRVGNSDEYYIAPERAGDLPILPDGGQFQSTDFRDSRGGVRRQGVRFSVYHYDSPDDPGTPVRAGQFGIERIEWTVHLANKKAVWYEFNVNTGERGYPPDQPLRNADVTNPDDRRQLIIDPGPRTLTGPDEATEFSRACNPNNYPMSFPPEGLEPRPIDSLGGLRTDAEGRLIVLGGYGSSGSSIHPPRIVNYANNVRWWDDTADGPVTARLIMQDGTSVEVEAPAWVIVAPPRYAPELVNVVSLYDSIFDTAVRFMNHRPDIFSGELWNTDYQPSWQTDILPILERAHHYQWVAAIPFHPHAFDFSKLGDPSPQYNRLRYYYLQVARPPSSPNLLNSPASGYPMMPLLCGDNCFKPAPLASLYLTLTCTQYFFLQQWAAGKFRTDPDPDTRPGEALDRAALENCVGGAYSPGIEMTWISRNPELYSEPFRIRHKRQCSPPLSLGFDIAAGCEPGDVSKYLAVPWQADFNECSKQEIGNRYVFWWPVQRPSTVRVRRHDRLEPVAWVGSERDQTAPDYIQFADDLDMVKLWHDLGFVFNQGTDDKPEFVEVERILERKLTATFGA